MYLWLVFLYAIILYILHMNHVNIHVLIIVQVQLYDPRTNGFAPSSPEIGMHVEIRDPEDKIILSKVRVVCAVSRVYVGSVGAFCTVCVPSVLFVYRLYCLCTVCTVCVPSVLFVYRLYCLCCRFLCYSKGLYFLIIYRMSRNHTCIFQG